ncbi:Copper insertion protein [Pseudodesulfovibrio profundus]|uniref:Copper insertion protein n=1 Tax=Pseudodesulfovibrio profundus TaxID=57320 RepID=A0A2C8F9X9_9BACT|nr:SCO family protein [Pseudodesulfovibrio profundus]SOB59308.1 Copper insertion protein [Pseudodesulfovibrio profundus]|tara:strand:+ start:3212 stop:4210 length:999 start_codon:yes stop_codon:yes gene_type:complete
MSTFMRHLSGAIIAIALLSVPVHAMQDKEMDHAQHGAASMEDAGHEVNKAEGTMDHSSMDMNTTDHNHGNMDMSDEDHANMDSAEHDHEAMMEEAGQEVGIEEKLGSILADVNFVDSQGNNVNLRELTKDIPTIMIPIYYRCPDVCNMLQGSFAEILPDVALKPGQEIQVVSISFDPRENRKDAARAKRTYIAATQGGYPAEHWSFLSAEGDVQSVNKWLHSIGYTVKREGGLYAHPVAVVAIAPGGKVVRYLYGSSFLPFDITMAGAEAATGKEGLSIKRMLSFCYNYDPEGRRYVFSILRVSGFAIFGFIGIFILYLVLSGRKHKGKKAN